MKRRLILMGIALAVVFGLLLGWNLVRSKLRNAYLKKDAPPPMTTTVITVKEQSWQSTLSSVGTLNAVQQVQVTTQVGGKVEKILFKDGQEVKQGDLLVVLDDGVQQAQLQSAIAQRDAAADKVTRYKPLVAEGAVSQLDYDNMENNYKGAKAQVAQAQANLQFVRVTAPFTGRLGIRQVNLGQLVQPGTNIVMLNTQGSLYCDFTLPEDALSQVFVGQNVSLTTNVVPNQTFSGKITAIDPAVDSTTRNFGARASFPNDDDKLTPGSFAKVQVELTKAEQVIAIPRTAVAYTLYGDTVFVVQPETKQEREGKVAYQVKKTAVTTGEDRGDQVVVTKGLTTGQQVVISGQLKLSDGDWVSPQEGQLTPPKEMPLE